MGYLFVDQLFKEDIIETAAEEIDNYMVWL